MSENILFTDNLFCILGSLFKGNEVTYISTPISTGERYINWYNTAGKNFVKNSESYKNELRKDVIEPNIKDANVHINNIRKTYRKVIIDPTTIESEPLCWKQEEFYEFWDRVIKELVHEIIFLDGWEYSVGCCHELISALEKNINIYTQEMKILTIQDALIKLNKSVTQYKSIDNESARKMQKIIKKLEGYTNNNAKELMIKSANYMKDEKLDLLISNEIANIAQFVSFEPNIDLVPKYIHINNFNDNDFLSNKETIIELIEAAPSKCVNIRSFSLCSMKGNKLIYGKGIEQVEEILSIIESNSLNGKHTIINENIPIDDGGVSGVALGNVIEFSPEDTPKCVDKEGVCTLPRDIALKILGNVYGISPDLKFDPNFRIEFSLHPMRQGVSKKHTIIWEYEYYEKSISEKGVLWPNRFSKFIGDKVFGLLLADALGIMVPRTTVIARKVAPFTFGLETGLKEKWFRTCPVTKEPGKYYSDKGWTDPFKLIDLIEKDGVDKCGAEKNREETGRDNRINIASIISQDAVEAVYSGAAIIAENRNNDIIEGVRGSGDKFMLGKQKKEKLPPEIINSVMNLNDQLRMYNKYLGDVNIEWVYDGTNVWLLQLSQMKNNNKYSKHVIVDGNPIYYEKVYTNDGLEALREKIKLLKDKNIGIELVGNVGITSHFGDLLRLADIPSILTENE